MTTSQNSIAEWVETEPGRAERRGTPVRKWTDEIRLDDIQAARSRIVPYVRTTPVITAEKDHNASFKLENLQVTGSFKARGAANKLLTLTDAERTAGVVACSTGNHGLAVATLADRLSIPATICVPRDVDTTKLASIRKTKAEVLLSGKNYDDAALEAEALAQEGRTLVHPFDDIAVIAGQGTIGLEIAEQMPDMTSVLVPISGGGLAAGTALAVKSVFPDVPVIGVAARNAAVLYQCLLAGHVIEVDEDPTIASALSGVSGRAIDSRCGWWLISSMPLWS